MRDFSDLRKYECYEAPAKPHQCIGDDGYFNWLLDRESEQWESVLSLDWFIFEEVRNKDDRIRVTFGLDTDDRWYENMD